MIRLGLRLTLAGGREALSRLAVIVIAASVGVGMLLAVLAGINAVKTQNDRYAWLETGYVPGRDSSAADPLWWRLRADAFDGKQIARVDLAATGPTSPVPPGIPHLPGPGQFYASPALSELLHSTPYPELGARYGGHQVGTIGSSALPAPNSLIIVIGHPVADLAHRADSRLVTSIATTAPEKCGECVVGLGINPNGMDLVLGVVALAILFPVLIFIGGATRLSAARREQRFAAMRLVGATPAQISVISTVESSVAALAGVALGFPLFFAIRSPLASISFTGAPFFTSDLSLTAVDVLVVALGVPVAAAIAARVALRRVQISPLGVTRRVTPRPPGVWRLLPLLAGIAELSWFAAVGAPRTTGGQTEVYFTGFLLVLVGLVLSGPWLTMIGSRLIVRWAARPGPLIAGRRLSDNPGAGFRAISGLAVALFVTSVAVGVITTLVFYSGGDGRTSTAEARTLDQNFFGQSTGPRLRDYIDKLPAGLTAELAAVPGVRGVTVIHEQPVSSPYIAPPGLVSCAQLARTPVIGRCPAGAQVVMVDSGFSVAFGTRSTLSDRIWQPSALTVAQLDALPVRGLVVATDGSTAAIETARTIMERAQAAPFPPDTLSALDADNSRLLSAYRQLANVVILVSLPIAGCSLAVSVAAGLNDRRRPFSLLRLSGTPVALLRRVLAFETALPLLVTAAVSVGVGFLSAHLFLRGQLGETLQAPGLSFYLLVVAGLVASLAVIASTLPLLERITGPDSARTD